MIRLLPLLALLLAACAPQQKSADPDIDGATGTDRVAPAAPAPPTTSASVGQAAPPPTPEPEAPTFAPRHLTTTLSGIAVEAVVFDARSHRLIVADQPAGPASRWPDARAAGRALGGLAAVNGGFFTPEGEPLGRIIVSGKSVGAINRASSLGSGFYVEKNGSPSLVRRDRFSGGREALQAGPFLVEKGRGIDGLSRKSSSARTLVATDGRHGWILARTGSCSLAGLSSALTQASIGGVKIHSALNLDGGRSSEIWVSGAVPGGPAATRPLWNKPVRNFLVLKTRD